MLKEIAGCGNRGVNTLIVGTFSDVPDAFSILQQLSALGLAFFIPQCRQDDSQCLRVIQTVHRSQFVAQHMRCPVLRYASANQTVQRLSRRPHDVGAHIVVFWLFQGFRTIFD
ncbi:Uncharacterised protein [Shigella sonnei]|nr:Uncharacterised protein [Shigella sonnei]